MTRSADVHLFICSRGQTLPRWREAFGRGARAARVDGEGLSKDVPDPTVVWLRLEPDQPAEQQLARVPGPLRTRPLVVMSDLPEDEEALACFAAGARGYCNTHAAPLVLQQVAAVVGQGGLWIGQSLMRRLLVATSALPAPAPAPANPQSDWAERLTERELQVAREVAGGASNKEVARSLDITERTVKAHIGAILDKLGVRDRLQLSLVVNGRLPPPSAAA